MLSMIVIEVMLVVASAWWRHDTETLSSLLALCAGNPLYQLERTGNLCVFYQAWSMALMGIV